MSTFKLEDKAAFHAKVVKAGNEAYGAWVRAGQWSSEHATDGIIPEEVALIIAPRRVWARLLAVGLLDASAPGEHRIHDFLDYNPSRETLAARRAKTRERFLATGKARAAQRGAQHPVQRDVQSPVQRDVAPVVQTEIHAASTTVVRDVPLDLSPSPSNGQLDLPVQGSAEPEAPKRRAAPKDVKPSKPPKFSVPAVPEAPASPEGYSELIDAYHRAYMATHNGVKPAISARTGKAAKDLLGMMPLADAVRVVENAFLDEWFVTTSSELWDLAAKPNRYRGASKAIPFEDFSGPSKFVRPVLTPEERAARARAAAEIEALLTDHTVHA